MSKLPPALKSLINAPFARPGALPAPANIKSVYEAVARDAASKNVGVPAWLSIATATTLTLNSPSSLTELHTLASPLHPSGPIATAALMREVALKCIGFNGVPRTINNLNALRAALPADVAAQLPTAPTRVPTPQNIRGVEQRGRALWASIYRPLDDKLERKLADAHPDLPVHILHSEYGALFADPPSQAGKGKEGRVGRVLTSLVAVACLRAQTGVGPQVLSHVFGLRKAFEDGTAEGEGEVMGGEWLASDEGCMWLLETTDRIVEALSEGRGGTFAAGYGRARESKL